MFHKNTLYIINICNVYSQNFVCSLCRMEFSDSNSLVIHYRFHTYNNSAPPAETSPKTVPAKETPQPRVRKPKKPAPKKQPRAQTKTKPPPKTLFKCEYCKTEFTSEERHRDHVESGACAKSCDICGATFLTMKKYRLHLRTHVKPYQCVYCSVKILTRKNLVRHMKLHEGIKPYR